MVKQKMPEIIIMKGRTMKNNQQIAPFLQILIQCLHNAGNNY